MTLCRDHDLVEQDIRRIDVETYAIATSHAETGWGDFASAQLSFPFIMALGLRYGRIDLKHFEDDIRADAGLKAQITMGEADGEATKIYADAFSKDKDFYAFWRRMEAYKQAFSQGGSMVLSPDSDFFRYFNDPSGVLPK